MNVYADDDNDFAEVNTLHFICMIRFCDGNV